MTEAAILKPNTLAVFSCLPHQADASSVCDAMRDVTKRDDEFGLYERALWDNVANTRPRDKALAATSSVDNFDERKRITNAAGALVESQSWDDICQAREKLRLIDGSIALRKAALDLIYVFDDWILAAATTTLMSVATRTKLKRERHRADIMYYRSLYWYMDDTQAFAACKSLRDAHAKLTAMQ
jgi:hypothetical protein